MLKVTHTKLPVVKKRRLQPTQPSLRSGSVMVQNADGKAKSEGIHASTTSAKVMKVDKGKERAAELVATPVVHPKSFKIIAGSYEKLLYGLSGAVSSHGSYTLKPIFAFPSHVSCVRTVAASPSGGKWLATGADDEIIKVWDLRRGKEVGGLMHHSGSITHLSFPSRGHLISASEDGTLCLFRARDWSVLRALKGHKGRVNSVAVHPSGKVALSCGKDGTLRMWDLMRGKGSASTKLGKEGEIVRWSTKGDLFIVQAQMTLDVYNTSMSLLHTINVRSRLHDAIFAPHPHPSSASTELLCVAAENRKVHVFQVPSDPSGEWILRAEFVGHRNRVKALDRLTISTSNDATTTIITTVSSDGLIRVFDLASLTLEQSEITPAQIEAVAEYDTKGTRLTCVTLADGEAAEQVPGEKAGSKRKRAEEDGSDSDPDVDAGEEAEEWAPLDHEQGSSQEEEEEREEEEDVEEEED